MKQLTMEETSVAKEPWQMTRDEYENVGIENRIKDVPAIDRQFARAQEQNQNLIYHTKQVKRAVALGKAVPAEVLKDYPELLTQRQV